MVEWRQLRDFPDYEISEYGSIRRLTDCASAKRGKVLRPKTDKYGYLCVRPFFRGVGKHLTVHRLVAITFLGDPSSLRDQVAHFDGNHKNNHYTNLRWATAKENKADMARHGRTPTGERHPRSVLRSSDVALMRFIDAQAKTWNFPFTRQKDIGMVFGMHQANVSALIRGLFRNEPAAITTESAKSNNEQRAQLKAMA